MGLPGCSAQLVGYEAEDLEHDNRGDVRSLLVGGVLCRHQAHHGLSPTSATYTALIGESTTWLLS